MSIETMTKLATVTVGVGGASSIDFTNIPQTYTDLKIVLSARIDASYRQVIIKFNNSSSNYTLKMLRGDGASAASFNESGFSYNMTGYAPLAGTDTASTFGNWELYMPN